MTHQSSRRSSRIVGVTCLVATGVVLLSTFLTWLQGGTSVGESQVRFVHLNLWQLGPASYGTATWYAVAKWLIVGGAFVIALAGVNELGMPVLSRLDRCPWAPSLIGTLLVAVGALGTEPPKYPSFWKSSLTMGPGKWVCIAGAAIGGAATIAIAFRRMPSQGELEGERRSHDLATSLS